MSLPPWLTLTCAAMVLLWGGYRISLGLRSREAEEKAKRTRGLFGLPRRTHLLIGLIYVLLGVGLVAITFGWDPLSAVRSAPASDTAKGDGIEVR